MSKSTPIAQIPINNELTDDDDLTVQEVLQQISQTSMMDSGGPPVASADPSDMLDRLKQLEQLEQIQRMSQAAHASPPTTPSIGQTPTTATAPTPTPAATWSAATSPLSSAIADLHSIRSMILVVILFIVVSLLPVDAWVAQYVPIHKFPHGAVLVRGLLAGVLFFAIQSYCGPV